MLIDIFARRYERVRLRDTFQERDRRLLVQATAILTEDICPYTSSTKEGSAPDTFWSTVHSRLSRELGLTELSPLWVFYTTKWNGNDVQRSYKNNPSKRCELWMLGGSQLDPDQHIKQRLSLIEVAFRQREEQLAAMNAEPIPIRYQRPAVTHSVSSSSELLDFGELMKRDREEATAKFRASVEELNERFRQARYELHYHNGYIQASTDELIQQTVENSFWALVANPHWINVDTDMKEALDLRDSGGRDPAFYAARALESAIKIVSDMKGWTTGKEKGAHNFVDRLAAKSHAFIEPWEAQSLKEFFTYVRNPFGHGAGSAEMPKLTRQQTEWAIEFSMSWIKSLIRRL